MLRVFQNLDVFQKTIGEVVKLNDLKITGGF